MQRTWIGLSLTGDEVTVEPLPFHPPYLHSLDVEVGFLRRGVDIAQSFSADEMAKNFVKAFNGVIFAAGEVFAFEFHGQNIKGTVKGVNVVELPDAQRHGAPPASNYGVLMEKTDVTIMKAPDSNIRIKSSAKK